MDFHSSRFELPGCLTPIACEAGQERLRLILSWGALPLERRTTRHLPCEDDQTLLFPRRRRTCFDNEERPRF